MIYRFFFLDSSNLKEGGRSVKEITLTDSDVPTHKHLKMPGHGEQKTGTHVKLLFCSGSRPDNRNKPFTYVAHFSPYVTI